MAKAKRGKAKKRPREKKPRRGEAHDHRDDHRDVPVPEVVVPSDRMGQVLYRQWEKMGPPIYYDIENGIPGVTDPLPLDPTRLDITELMKWLRRLGFPGGIDRWAWLIRLLMQYLRFLQRLEELRRTGRLETAGGGTASNQIRDLMNEMFGTTDTPLGPGGLVYDPGSQHRYVDRACANDARFPIEFADMIESAISGVISTIITATLGRFVPGERAQEIAEEVADAFAEGFVAEIQIAGTFEIRGSWIQHWQFDRGDLPPQPPRAKCREAINVAYSLTEAIPVEALAGVAQLVDLGGKLKAIFDLIRDTFSQPGDTLWRYFRGELDFDDFALPDASRVTAAARSVLDGLARVGEVRGLTLTQRPTSGSLPPPPLEYTWERHIIFSELAGPNVPPVMATATSEVYPVAIINTIVVPPGSTYFLQQLSLDYIATLEVGFSANLEEALGRGLRTGFRRAVDALKNRVRQYIPGG